jgi:hypothetical protein
MKATALVSAVLLVLLVGCGTPTVTDSPDPAGTDVPSAAPETTSAAPRATTANVGSTITLQGYEESLKVAVTLVKVFPDRPGANEFEQPQPGNRFFVVQLVLKNVGTAAYSDSPSNGAYVIDSEGQQHASTVANVRGLQGFAGGSVTLSAGDQRRGVLVFDVPEKAKIVKLQFALESGMADQKGEWRLT